MPLIRLLSFGDWLRHRARLRTWDAAHAWGRRGEDLAHRYLQRKGYRIVARNLEIRGTGAELDIVARDGSKLVFVEVKTRATSEFGAPETAVDREKREHVVRAAGAYLKAANSTWENTRFDIISVTLEPGLRIEHHRDAFVREEF